MAFDQGCIHESGSRWTSALEVGKCLFFGKVKKTLVGSGAKKARGGQDIVCEWVLLMPGNLWVCEGRKSMISSDLKRGLDGHGCICLRHACFFVQNWKNRCVD